MKYLWGERFTVPMGGDAKYRANWDAIFGPKAESAPAPKPGDPCPCESGKAFVNCHGAETAPSDE